MRLIKPLVIVEDDLGMIMPNGVTLADHMAKKIELFTRKCYKSEGKMTEESHKKFLPAVYNTKRHTGIAEHRLVSVTFISDRGVSHEGVRHRMAAYLQESTRYCDYADEGKAAKGVTYVIPPWVGIDKGHTGDYAKFLEDLHLDDERYNRWRAEGWRPEEARYWLPQGVKTEYAASLNLGSWWNFFMKRTDVAAHPSMRQLAIPLLRYFKKHLPQFYSNLPDLGRFEDCGNAGVFETGTFEHKGVAYLEAKLVVNPFYDQVEFEEVQI